MKKKNRPVHCYDGDSVYDVVRKLQRDSSWFASGIIRFLKKHDPAGQDPAYRELRILFRQKPPKVRTLSNCFCNLPNGQQVVLEARDCMNMGGTCATGIRKARPLAGAASGNGNHKRP